jgi:hypothetical protein
LATGPQTFAARNSKAIYSIQDSGYFHWKMKNSEKAIAAADLDELRATATMEIESNLMISPAGGLAA